MIKLEKKTDDIGQRYNNKVEVAKGLFVYEGPSRGTSCAPSRLDTNENENSTYLDSMVCAPALSRIEDWSLVESPEQKRHGIVVLD
jgi:hypothetical protein